MKVLKILAVAVGSILLLTGVGLYLGYHFLGVGTSYLERSMHSQGFVGPTQATVKAVDQSAGVDIYTVQFTDDTGATVTSQGTFTSTGSEPAPKVGQRVPVYYYPDHPETVVIVSVPQIGAASGALWTAAVVVGGLGAVLLVAGILGLALGRRRPLPPAVTQPYPLPYGPPGPGYPPPPPPAGFGSVPQPQTPYPQAPYPPTPYPPDQYPGNEYPPLPPHR